jgi:hypothetical protein
MVALASDRIVNEPGHSLLEERNMLKELNADQARFVAILAKAARTQRDELLREIPEKELADVIPARGEHNPSAMLAFEPLRADAAQTTALREAISSLSSDARAELYTLMRIGQGHLAAKKWHRGLTEANLLGTETISAALLEDVDLHDHLLKGLYESDLAS